MHLLNTKGKLLISNCRNSEEDLSFPLMWFGFKKKKKSPCLLITSLISVAAIAVQRHSFQVWGTAVWISLQSKSQESLKSEHKEELLNRSVASSWHLYR